MTINEVRGEQGLEPVPWGDAPWLPRLWAQTNDENRNTEHNGTTEKQRKDK